MSYQRCPICNGEGIISTVTTICFETCPTCRGARIIDEVTGLPPGIKVSFDVDVNGETFEKRIKDVGTSKRVSK